MSLYVATYREPSLDRRRQVSLVAERMGASNLHFPTDFDLFYKKAELGPEVSWVPLETTVRAIPLTSFEHPDDVVYVVGPQNGTIPYDVLDRLNQPVYVETHPTSPSPVLPTPVVVGVVLHHRISTRKGVST